MEHLKMGVGYPVLLLMALIASGCGSSGSGNSGTQKFSYATTSSRGDYSEWTLTGGALTATLNVVDAGGAIDHTWDITATCGSADASGIRHCTTDSSSCTAGVSACTGSFVAAFDIMDVPGVALFVQTGGATAQLHIGLAKDSTACSQDVSGDYTMIRTGLGLTENFGMYRSDANFIDILHSEFGFETPDANVSQTVVYRTGTESEMFADDGCVDGVRTRTSGGTTLRSMMTAGGLSVVDLPAGQGGVISFKVANAATLSDFAGKSFGGISFPDNAPPEFFGAVSGPLAGGQVHVTGTPSGGGSSSSVDIQALATAATATAPTYPDFTISPPGYSSSMLFLDYASPAAIPGLFKLDNPSDAGRVVMAGMKFGGKVIGVGMVYNYRGPFDTNPATGAPFPALGLYNTGNFLFFER